MSTPPQHLAESIIAHIKVMAKLEIAERHIAQEGRISLVVTNIPVDARVSTRHSEHGEALVMQLNYT